MWLYKIFLILVLSFAISSCGFRPLYSSNNPDNAGICNIKDSIIENHNNEISISIRNNIVNYLKSCKTINAHGKVGKIVISAKSHEVGAIFLRTGQATRKQMIINAEVVIYDNKMSHIKTFSVSNYDAYNSLDTPFSEYISAQNSIQNAAKGISQKIIIKLNHFASENKNG